MHKYQREFLQLALDCGVLRFGEFTLKSGRVSPYFFNLGQIDHGAALARLGRCYAAALGRTDAGYDMLFGPAYKGIALTVATAIALVDEHARDVPFAFNRKEAKRHGEGGALIGAPLAGRVLIVDDVITAGTAVRESLALIAEHRATPAGVLVALDRDERHQGKASTSSELAAEYGIPVMAIAGFDELLEFTALHDDLRAEHPRLLAYRGQYGAR